MCGTEYVRKRLGDEWPLSQFSREDRTAMAKAADLQLRRANALIHPTIIGNERIQPPGLLVAMAALSTMMTLLAYHVVAFEEYDQLSAQDEQDRFGEVERSGRRHSTISHWRPSEVRN